MTGQTSNSWIRRVLIVVKKELRDHSRDRRALMLALIYPMLGPLLVAGGLLLAGKTLQGDFREHFVTVPAVGIERAPELKAYLERELTASNGRRRLREAGRRATAYLLAESVPHNDAERRVLHRCWAPNSHIQLSHLALVQLVYVVPHVTGVGNSRAQKGHLGVTPVALA